MLFGLRPTSGDVPGMAIGTIQPMPTYGYLCDSCGNEFELWQKMSDPPGATCPVCGQPGRRLFYPAGIVFRGSGFYKTDSRSSGGSSSSSTSTPPSSGSATGGEADSKPAKDAAKPVSDGAAPASGDAKPAGPDKTGGSPSPAKDTP